MAEVFNIVNYKLINQVSGIAFAHYIEPAKTTKVEVAGAGFFNKIADQLAVGSIIMCSVKDGVVILYVKTNTKGVVTMAEVAASV